MKSGQLKASTVFQFYYLRKENKTKDGLLVYPGRKIVWFERNFCLFQTEIRYARCASLFQSSSCKTNFVKQTQVVKQPVGETN